MVPDAEMMPLWAAKNGLPPTADMAALCEDEVMVRTPLRWGCHLEVVTAIWGTSQNDWRGWNRHYRCISGIRLGSRWKLRTLDKPFGFLVLKPSGVRFAEVSFRNHLVTWGHMAGIWIRIRFIWVVGIWLEFGLRLHLSGVVASRAQWRF